MLYLLPTNSKDPRSGSVFIIFLLVIVVLFLKSHSIFAQTQVSKVSPAGTKFWIYTPAGYSPSASTTYPVLVCLHGGSEIGTDLNKLTSGTSHQIPSRLIYLKQWPQTLPFIVVTPLLKRDASIPNPNDQEWPATYVNEVVDYVKSTYKVDATRMYFTGISLGAAGCWDYAFAYPTKVAALVPISGKSRPEKACLVKGIPIWAFHGESDALVTAQFTVDMINAINKCSPPMKPRLNLLYARAHEGWNEIYNGTNGYKVYDWMLKFKKNNTANKLPYVNAGPDHKILLRTKPLTLVGDYFDTDGTIASVKWTQTAGAALTLAGTTTKFLKLSNLKAGTFEFLLTIKDNKGGISTDRVGLTIVSTATTPNVSNLVLMNGKTNRDIGNITEGQVINKTTLGLTEINVRATVSSGVGSVRFSINSDDATRTVNASGPYLITKQITAPEWQIKNGDYVICATPYPQTGARGTPGISQCYKVTVTSTSTAREAEENSVAISMEGDHLRANRSENIQWILNGEEIENANEPLILPQKEGEYIVRYNAGDETFISNSISISALRKSETPVLRLFPNPVSNEINVEGLDVANGTHQYSIMNASGFDVQRGTISPDGNIQLNSTLPQGLYLLIIRDGNNERTLRFVVE